MTDDPFDFGRRKPTPKIDFDGLPAPVPEPDPEREAAALVAGERRGYVSREQLEPVASVPHQGLQARQGASAGSDASDDRPGAVQRVRTKVKKVEYKNVMIRSPIDIADRFIAMCNDFGYTAYWALLEDLMDGKAGPQ